MKREGSVIWITGLAGSGKTTIASALYSEMAQSMNNVIFLDGDELRKSIAYDLGYTSEERKQAAMRYARLCDMLARQGLCVIIATISMFHDIRKWNRENIDNYCEVYLKVPMEVLQARNQKHLYTEGAAGVVNNVVGMDIEVEEPITPNIVIQNNGDISVEQCVQIINAQIQKGFYKN